MRCIINIFILNKVLIAIVIEHNHSTTSTTTIEEVLLIWYCWDKAFVSYIKDVYLKNNHLSLEAEQEQADRYLSLMPQLNDEI